MVATTMITLLGNNWKKNHKRNAFNKSCALKSSYFSFTYPSITKCSYVAGLSQTGQFHVGFRSFICRYSDASKHCKCEQDFERHGVDIRIFPSGHMSDTRSSVVAISQSASSCSFSRTKLDKNTIWLNFSVCQKCDGPKIAKQNSLQSYSGSVCVRLGVLSHLSFWFVAIVGWM